MELLYLPFEFRERTTACQSGIPSDKSFLINSSRAPPGLVTFSTLMCHDKEKEDNWDSVLRVSSKSNVFP